VETDVSLEDAVGKLDLQRKKANAGGGGDARDGCCRGCIARAIVQCVGGWLEREREWLGGVPSLDPPHKRCVHGMEDAGSCRGSPLHVERVANQACGGWAGVVSRGCFVVRGRRERAETPRVSRAGLVWAGRGHSLACTWSAGSGHSITFCLPSSFVGLWVRGLRGGGGMARTRQLRVRAMRR